jgi:hypothetical protein
VTTTLRPAQLHAIATQLCQIAHRLARGGFATEAAILLTLAERVEEIALATRSKDRTPKDGTCSPPQEEKSDE